MPTRVKICGFTRPGDAVAAAELGADFFGLNFFSGPRKIKFSVGEAILAALADDAMSVGLFVHDFSKVENRYEGPADNQAYCHNHLKLRQVYGVLDAMP